MLLLTYYYISIVLAQIRRIFVFTIDNIIVTLVFMVTIIIFMIYVVTRVNVSSNTWQTTGPVHIKPTSVSAAAK